jgi:adenylate cyclase
VGEERLRTLFHFDGFCLDVDRGQLIDRSSSVVEIRPKSFSVLRYLLDNPNRIVSRDELIEAVWPGVFVSDDSLTQCIAEVRKGLGSDGARLLRTMPKRGYVMSAHVVPSTSSQATGACNGCELGSGEPANERMNPSEQPSIEGAVGASKRPVRRKLAAIMMADVVGYSRMMGSDEVGTLSTFKEFRKTVIDPLITEHEGRIVRMVGDGFLVDFASAVDAVTCAVAVQSALFARNCDIDEERRITLRVGINLGDVIIDEEDIFGDGVNVAARLEAMCEPGGLLISRAIRDQIRGKVDLPFSELGERQVKNIARPLRVFSLGASEISRLSDRVRPSCPEMPQQRVSDASSLPHSIAVLPFAALGDDPAVSAFMDGLTDSLTTDLATCIEGLFVIASSTAFTYKGKAVDIRQIGRDLNVRYVLEGSVQQGHQLMRVNAKLVDASTGTSLWAERFDADCGDFFLLQDRVAARIANSLGARLLSVSAQEAAKRDQDPGVEDLIIRARAAVLRIPMLLAQHKEAEALLSRALVLHPQHPQVLAELGLNLILQILNWGYELNLPMRERIARLEEARQLVESALAQRYEIPAAHNARGLLLTDERKWREAALAFETALQMNPIQAGVWGNLAHALIYLGEPERAIALLEEALRRSPRDANLAGLQNFLGLAYLAAGNHHAAIDWFLKSRVTRPTYARVHVNLALAYAGLGNTDAAQASFAEAKRLNPRLLLSGILSTSLVEAVGKLRALIPVGGFGLLTGPGLKDHELVTQKQLSLQSHTIIYREGHPQDGAALLSVHRRAVELIAARSYGPEIAESWVRGLTPEGYGRSMQNGEIFRVATVNSIPVGFCGFKDYEISGLFVDPDYIGLGIGSKLLTDALSILTSRNRTPVRVVSSLNALHFYQLHGFNPVEEDVNITRGGLVIKVVELEWQPPSDHSRVPFYGS